MQDFISSLWESYIAATVCLQESAVQINSIYGFRNQLQELKQKQPDGF